MADIIEFNSNEITSSEHGFYIDWSGWSGPSGHSGKSGCSGASGWSGKTGYDGYTGLGGMSGWSGASGQSGWSGWSGWSGASGENQLLGVSGAIEYSLTGWMWRWAVPVPPGFQVVDFLIPPQTLHAIQILESGPDNYMQTCELTDGSTGPLSLMPCCSLDRPRPAQSTVSDKYFAWAKGGSMFVVEITGWSETLAIGADIEIGGISPDGRFVWGYASSAYGASGMTYIWSGY